MLHKPIIRKFKKRTVIVGNIDDIWSGDLVDMQQLKSYNRGFRYILNVIDVFSNFVWSVPIKDKTSKTITNSSQSIVKASKRKPRNCGLIMDLNFITTYLKNCWLRMKLKCIVHLMKAKPLLLKDLIVH